VEGTGSSLILGICLEKLRKTTQYRREDNWSPGRVTNLGSREYDAGALSTRLHLVPRNIVGETEARRYTQLWVAGNTRTAVCLEDHIRGTHLESYEYR
jgi:hypothetical protein